MNESELARKLALSNAEEQVFLLEKHASFNGLSLAEELKKLCYEAWLSNPETTKRIVSAFQILKKSSVQTEIEAFALWALGIGEILEGRMRPAIVFFDKSKEKFQSLKKPIAAAETQVGKLYSLAVLGLYDEAVECGLQAREVFLNHNEIYAVGKIEHNLGNIYLRRDLYEKAEHFFRIARERFHPNTDFQKLIQIDNSLANAVANQHKFREAEEIYGQAFEKASKENLEFTEAEIESSLGHLLMFQGRLDLALKYFESSRRRFEKMNLPHQAAMSEQEVADAYLELNLAPESIAIYEKVVKVFDELAMTSEKARTLINFARSCVLLGETTKAHILLDESQKIYASVKNFVGEANVKFAVAKLFHAEKNYQMALENAVSAEEILMDAKFFSRALHARWLHGECLRLSGKTETAREILQTTLEEADKKIVPQVSLLCQTSLGQMIAAENNFEKAESHFKQAIEIVEEMRSPLPAEDFRTAFLADKLTPYNELVRLYLKQNEIEKAFSFTENARSKVLLELLDDNFESENFDESSKDLQSITRLEKLREELNWLYSNLNRLPFEADFDATKLEKLQIDIRERENEILEINRKHNIFAKNFASK
jgi:tetratricopeptide (TPR) repeat protein